ncbi:MAG: glycosyltransferase family 39 protein [Anaerolineae bacterium]
MKGRWLDLLAVVILVAALVARLSSLDVFVAADELRWVCRSLSFGQALASFQPRDTFLTGHPGVVTMWLGTLAVPPGAAPDVLATCKVTENASAPSGADAQALAGLAALLFRMRFAPALLNWLLLIPIYWLTRRLLGPLAGVFGLALLAFDPFVMAHSRVFHLDATLSSLLLLSALTLLAARPPAPALSLTRGDGVKSQLGWGWLVAAGMLAGAALVQKVAAVFLWPWAVLMLVYLGWRDGRWRGVIRAALLFAAGGLVAVLLLWPSAWSNPVGTVRGVADKAAVEGGNPHAGGNVFDEEVVDDPGPFMYVVAYAFRASPWTLLGLGLAVVAVGAAVYRARRELRRFVLSPPPFVYAVVGLASYALIFAVLISFSPKKFDRYILPIFPPLDLVAGAGLAAAVGWLAAWGAARTSLRVARWLPGAAILVVLVTEAGMAVAHAPYYLTYYNPVLGGGQAAVHWLLVGWGEGYDQAATYLNSLPDAENLQVAARGVSQFAPLFVGETRSAPGFRPYQTDYVVLYLNEVQRQRNQSLVNRYYNNPDEHPLRVIDIDGINYAWIYTNTTATAPLAYISQNARPGDGFVVNGASLAARSTPTGLPVAKVYGHFQAPDVAGSLAALPPVQRLWYLRYPEGDPGAALDVLREAAILEAGPKKYPDVEVWRFRTAPAASQPSNSAFGPVSLVGWGAGQQALAPGQPEGVSLAWRVDAPIPEPLVVAVDIVDPEGGVVATAERPLRDSGLRPATGWSVGTTATTLMPLTLPAATPPGDYNVRVRLKKASSGEPVGAAEGIALGKVAVSRGATPAKVDVPTRLDLDLASVGLRLLGHGFQANGVVKAGQTVDVPLWWQAAGPVKGAQVVLSVRDAAGRVVQTAQGLLPTPIAPGAWQAGDVFSGIRRAKVAPDAARGPATVELQVVDETGQALLPAPAVLGRVWVDSPAGLSQLRQPPQHAVNAALGDAAHLLGYDVAQAQPGAPLSVTLYWKADAPAPADYNVFVHLLAPDGSIISQVDQRPGFGHYPTSAWRAGEIVVDPYTLSVPAGTPPGKYRLAVGWYDAAGNRLPVRDTSGAPQPDDRLLLDVDIQ